MMIRERSSGVLYLYVAGEHYTLSRVNPLADRCDAGHELLGAQTIAGVWFVVDEECESAWLADPRILELISPSTRAATATVISPPLLGSGE